MRKMIVLRGRGGRHPRAATFGCSLDSRKAAGRGQIPCPVQLGGFDCVLPTRRWNLWPDDRGFLMTKRGEIKPQPVTETILVQNWFEELKRLVPTGKR